tara:strand:+ start:497 stop:706 length:210 start_codon:yes stop_codon:yes gene_type:complete
MNKILLIFILYLSLIKPVYAYLDPGSGSIILQAIIASLAAAGTTISVFWKKIKIFFSKVVNLKNKKKTN